MAAGALIFRNRLAEDPDDMPIAPKTRSDTYTSATSGTAITLDAQTTGSFGLQVKQTGTVTSWTVLLEISLDGTNYVEILRHTKVDDGDGAYSGTGTTKFPALYCRSRCEAVTLGAGTNAIATIIGIP
jgi:hypothetical protein